VLSASPGAHYLALNPTPAVRATDTVAFAVRPAAPRQLVAKSERRTLRASGPKISALLGFKSQCVTPNES